MVTRGPEKNDQAAELRVQGGHVIPSCRAIVYDV